MLCHREGATYWFVASCHQKLGSAVARFHLRQFWTFRMCKISILLCKVVRFFLSVAKDLANPIWFSFTVKIFKGLIILFL